MIISKRALLIVFLIASLSVNGYSLYSFFITKIYQIGFNNGASAAQKSVLQELIAKANQGPIVINNGDSVLTLVKQQEKK